MTPALYIHLPFCKQKCNYCDFISYAGKEDLIDQYVETLIKEIEEQRYRGTKGVKTVFFGGGTPTLLEPRHFEKIINTIICHWSLDIGHSEISVEANPGTADKAKLQALRELGLNRLSIGVQSFNDRHLKTLGRIHDAASAKQFYHDARAAGFENINLDLIFALPGQTLAEWQEDLRQAVTLNPDHLSIYNLQIEEGTPFYAQRVTLELPTEETELAMYEYAIETLTAAGYKHYEISNFAKPGKECHHNINYWQMGNWLGFGAGAHSHVDGKLWSNPNCVEAYLKTPSSNVESAVADETRGGKLFMGLRLLDGLPTGKFQGFEKEVAELITDGLLKEERGNYQLTKQGLYLGNLVFEKFV